MHKKDKARLHRSFYDSMSLHQLKQSKDQLEAYNTKAGLVIFRKKLLEDQNKNNYSIEKKRYIDTVSNYKLFGSYIIPNVTNNISSKKIIKLI